MRVGLYWITDSDLATCSSLCEMSCWADLVTGWFSCDRKHACTTACSLRFREFQERDSKEALHRVNSVLMETRHTNTNAGALIYINHIPYKESAVCVPFKWQNRDKR